jgi:hypothetical protein
MSWGTCFSGSNNIHFEFPPIMSDGRNFSSWQPGSVLSEEMRNNAGIKTNWEYRKYMTENADQIIKMNQLSACDQCSTVSNMKDNSSDINNNSTSNVPFIFKSSSDKSMPTGYETSDLKNIYLSQFQLQSRMTTPVVSQDQLLERGIPRRF